MSKMTSVFHGVEIPESLLAAELQNHQAGSLSEARAMAGRALAVKAVLLARARELGLQAAPERNSDGQEETDEESLIRLVLSEEVEPEGIDEAAIKAVYDRRPDGFKNPPLIEASHILIAPEDTSDGALEQAGAKAQALIEDLRANPAGFAKLAAAHSACPSRAQGGSLGQLRPGDVLAGIWKALTGLDIAEIGAQPVLSEHGWHVLRVDHRSDSERLPFDYVRSHIAIRLEARAWTRAAAEYAQACLSRVSVGQGLALDEQGRLDDGNRALKQADSLLGKALMDTDTAYAALSDAARKRLDAAASEAREPSPQTLGRAIRTFLSRADDAAWTQLISRLRDSETPLSDCLDLIIDHQLAPLHETHTLIKLTR